MSTYPRTHYEFDGSLGAFEEPYAGSKKLPLVSRGSKSNDVMYAQAHRMWNDLSKETRTTLEPIYSKILKNTPGNYSDGSRAFAVSKDIQTSIYNKFLNDNRFPVKDYEEWLEYLDDVVLDEDLLNYAKRVHDGYWYDNGYIDTSDKGIEALRESLKYYNGGKLIPRKYGIR